MGVLPKTFRAVSPGLLFSGDFVMLQVTYWIVHSKGELLKEVLNFFVRPMVMLYVLLFL